MRKQTAHAGNFPQSAVKAERMRSFHSEDSAVFGKAENEAVRKISN